MCLMVVEEAWCSFADMCGLKQSGLHVCHETCMFSDVCDMEMSPCVRMCVSHCSVFLFYYFSVAFFKFVSMCVYV